MSNDLKRRSRVYIHQLFRVDNLFSCKFPFSLRVALFNITTTFLHFVAGANFAKVYAWSRSSNENVWKVKLHWTDLESESKSKTCRTVNFVQPMSSSRGVSKEIRPGRIVNGSASLILNELNYSTMLSLKTFSFHIVSESIMFSGKGKHPISALDKRQVHRDTPKCYVLLPSNLSGTDRELWYRKFSVSRNGLLKLCWGFSLIYNFSTGLSNVLTLCFGLCIYNSDHFTIWNWNSCCKIKKSYYARANWLKAIYYSSISNGNIENFPSVYLLQRIRNFFFHVSIKLR